ncbi:hypothetical protein [Nesterenkonia halotolerans]|uniref:Uncharacterized protein n=1 Tax=Nesterenkonia halotolerans TaxID=225325 RepID=A0ABR9J367_9MICC|nr:hypothetical protein [Nesterenkonia halotolerans]MBE1513442.1 hypothetical protein [Nesterenkonia halotolerans]
MEQQPAGLSYRELSSFNALRRTAESWGRAELVDHANVAHTGRANLWAREDRLPWSPEDVIVAGLAGSVGLVSVALDSHADQALREGLYWLKSTPWLRQWEADAARLPIDYTGRYFGGPAHRVRSAGHDIARFPSALMQIRDGTFTGIRWENKVKIVEHITTTPRGNPFARADDPLEAAALLLKHWAADVVTPMSLPLPGWTLLYEMPHRELRKFAHEAYSGMAPGEGLNIRSGLLTPSLGSLAVELIIRTHIHLQSLAETGTPTLRPAMRAKLTEMLLAGQGLIGAASLTKAAAMTVAQAPLALGHINVPALIRTGTLAIELQRIRRERLEAGPPTWSELAAIQFQEMSLEELSLLEELLSSAAPAH